MRGASGSPADERSRLAGVPTYETAGLDVADVDPDPIVQWQLWYSQATEAGCVEPNAFVLSTVDDDGLPQSRYLLARGVDERGFAFFTNYESAKSRQLSAEPPGGDAVHLAAAAPPGARGRGRRAVAGGRERRVLRHRGRGRRRSARGRRRSRSVLPDRAALEERVVQFEQTFADVEEIPRPVYWGGWLLRPVMYEFWQGRPSRLHDRVRYRRVDDDADPELSVAGWIIERVAP